MKPVSRDQATALIRRFSLVDFRRLDHDRLQSEVLGLPEDEFVRRVTAFINNNCQLIIKGPDVLAIDRTKPFDPEKFIGSGWSDVVEDEDQAALKLTEVNFSKIRFESGLAEKESTITGEQKLSRFKRQRVIRLDAKIGQTLLEEKGQATLRFLYDTFGIRWMEFAGTVLRQDGDRCFLYLNRYDDGSWGWNYYWLDADRGRDVMSPLLAS